MAVSRQTVLRLYKDLLRTSLQFHSYNFRNYAVRRVRERFRESAGVTEADTVEKLVRVGEQELKIVRRQALVNELYHAEELIIEKGGIKLPWVKT
mmetsp:Transcript_36335/g.102378  ORF Transcript_36335/g.102378 Transcript_36335/m.102378 type:complete len:95 (-) Transcript_36335:219-503(-)|eukprot:CAMPEP_0119124290 /NCGR_PEP_ID=MMETSP1310-20130426/3957_1 /TAXON_ID=464262 /ORGANISM="Genus nov. species nov., Strain RCC2339" /LENGTH=94 /DNA_ID=CAMNT_0007114217 /DNA_START=154 /DNA_END=438 /DNA_ORIENTATION=-